MAQRVEFAGPPVGVVCGPLKVNIGKGLNGSALWDCHIEAGPDLRLYINGCKDIDQAMQFVGSILDLYLSKVPDTYSEEMYNHVRNVVSALFPLPQVTTYAVGDLPSDGEWGEVRASIEQARKVTRER
jgi:hypothetical protein